MSEQRLREAELRAAQSLEKLVLVTSRMGREERRAVLRQVVNGVMALVGDKVDSGVVEISEISEGEAPPPDQPPET